MGIRITNFRTPVVSNLSIRQKTGWKPVLQLNYFILEAKKAIIREGIENTQTRAVYRNAKVAMAGNANV
jgi:hypothetical protein